MLSTLLTTAAGAVFATAGVLAGALVSHRAQDRQWLRDRQLVAYQDLLTHYAKFVIELKTAHAAGSGWGYDWGEWSAVLTRSSLVAPYEVAVEIDAFAKAVGVFLDRAARTRDPRVDPLSDEEFAQTMVDPARAQVSLVNAIRRSLSRSQKGLSFSIGGSHPG